MVVCVIEASRITPCARRRVINLCCHDLLIDVYLAASNQHAAVFQADSAVIPTRVSEAAGCTPTIGDRVVQLSGIGFGAVGNASCH
jgi:hypothetical protein